MAIHLPVTKAGERILHFGEVVKEIADELGIPSIPVDDTSLLAAYGHPALTRKEHVRRVGRTIWPGLNVALSRRAAVDAAITGLYVQVQRLFSLHEVTA